ncbi:MAG: biopolymer transporter ExbD [Acidobacteria bacterium]|nr:biopolymer transporter ExbD [Acidobacteriota bacterium]
MRILSEFEHDDDPSPRRGRTAPQGEINVTPLVDVVLVLLIIFMVLTPALQMGIDVEIPPKVEVENPEMVPDEEQLVVRVAADGWWLNRTSFATRNELRDALAPILASREESERVVFFDSADELAFERAVEGLDVARAAGATRIGFLTEPVGNRPAAGSP